MQVKVALTPLHLPDESPMHIASIGKPFLAYPERFATLPTRPLSSPAAAVLLICVAPFGPSTEEAHARAQATRLRRELPWSVASKVVSSVLQVGRCATTRPTAIWFDGGRSEQNRRRNARRSAEPPIGPPLRPSVSTGDLVAP